MFKIPKKLVIGFMALLAPVYVKAACQAPTFSGNQQQNMRDQQGYMQCLENERMRQQQQRMQQEQIEEQNRQLRRQQQQIEEMQRRQRY